MSRAFFRCNAVGVAVGVADVNADGDDG